MDRLAKDPEQNHKSQNSGRAVAVRVYWMFLGFIPMVASISAVIESTNVPSAADFAYWASVISISLARFYDVTRLNGRTAEGDPATIADWRRHAGWLTVIATIVWISIRIISGRS